MYINFVASVWGVWAMADLDLELRGGGGGCFTCPAGYSSLCHFFFFTQNKVWEGGPPGPLP